MSLYARDSAESEAKRLGVINGPAHENLCGHSREDYVCTFVIDESIRVSRTYDLYVFDQNSRYGPHICLRFGNKKEDYLSPGSLAEAIGGTTQSAVKFRMREILMWLGKITWVMEVRDHAVS
jgi:hypothetical protein